MFSLKVVKFVFLLASVAGDFIMQKIVHRFFLFFFFDIRFIVHREFVPQGQPVNRELNCEVLRRLKGDVRRKRPYMWFAKNLIFSEHHQDFVTREFHDKYNILSHPPYPPHLAPADFHRFPKQEMQLKDRHFNTVAEIKDESQKILDSLPINK